MLMRWQPSTNNGRQTSSSLDIVAVQKSSISPLGDSESSDAHTTGSNSSRVQQSIDAQVRQIDLFKAADSGLLNSISSPELEQDQLFHQFTEAISPSGQTYLSQAHRQHGRLMQRISSVTTSNLLLNNAIRAVTLAHMGRSQQSSIFGASAMPFYGKALRLLNTALPDGEKGLSDETLAATILLSWYEMFSSGFGVPWIKHAGGAATLIKMRGPARHRTGFGRELFLTYRLNLVLQAFESISACFLDEPEWQELTRKIESDLHLEGLVKENEQFYDSAELFWSRLVLLPRLVRDVHNFCVLNRNAGQDPDFTIRALTSKVKGFKANFDDVYSQCNNALVSSGYGTTQDHNEEPLFPIASQYASQYIASLKTTYWTVAMIIDILLKKLEPDVDHMAIFDLESEKPNETTQSLSLNVHGVRFARNLARKFGVLPEAAKP